ncbi:hypothetical protein FRC08_001716 [Ceratobasidium sp. 394]|nr:hypothetical protein FRC08_001716 [Ceratobasidium sp. 394]
MTDFPELQKGELGTVIPARFRPLILPALQASLPPHSQLLPIFAQTDASGRIFEELVMDPNAPFDFYSFKQSGYLTVAMESQAEVWDVFPGARYVRSHPVQLPNLTMFHQIVSHVSEQQQHHAGDFLTGTPTGYFDGTAELHASSQPTALMHLDSFEIAFQSSDPTCSVK